MSDVDVEITRDVRLDEVEEFGGTLGLQPMARETFADDLSRGDVEGREERGRAVALVVVAAPDPPARGASAKRGWERSKAWIVPSSFRRHREPGHDPAAPNTSATTTSQRCPTAAADRGPRLHEEGIARQLEGLRAMRLQAEGPPDAMNGRGRTWPARPRHRAKAPMGQRPAASLPASAGPLPRWRHRRFDAARRQAGFVVQTVEALRRIAVDATCPRCPRSPRDERRSPCSSNPSAAAKDDPSPPRKPLRRLATTRPAPPIRRARHPLKEIVTATLAINRAS